MKVEENCVCFSIALLCQRIVLVLRLGVTHIVPHFHRVETSSTATCCSSRFRENCRSDVDYLASVLKLFDVRRQALIARGGVTLCLGIHPIFISP